jgi:hypothetical protein
VNYIRCAHLVIGTLGLAAFLLSGQYMHWFLGHLQGMPDAPRLLYRTSHIYLLWSSLLNLLLGCYMVHAPRRIQRFAQSVASLALLVGPVLLAASFFIESPSSGPQRERPLAHIAIYLATAGVLVHAASHAASFAVRRGAARAV